MSADQKDRGWDFLNSDEDSYHGSDSSWGSKSYDGSATYHGADGSWGYKESDGSVSYYGADGSWGWRNSDGSGSYHGVDGSYSAYDARSTSDDDDSSTLESLGSILDAGLKALELIYATAEQERRNEERQRQREAREKRHQLYTRHWKAILAAFLCLVLIAVSAVGVWQYRKLIPIGHSSDSLKGQRYEDVVPLLTAAGFTDVSVDELFDLAPKDNSQSGLISQISIGSDCSFEETDRFPYDTKVVISFHSLRPINPPASHKELRKLDYTSVLAQMEAAGFINITVEPIYDVVLAWFKKDGDVETVSIAGETKFSNTDYFSPDAEVIISYHTLKSNADSGI